MAPIQQKAQGQPERPDYAYNLFRNKDLPEIVCAVPEDRPVPEFIGPDHWIFEQPLRPSDTCPPGFQKAAAHAGVRFNGFYLFQVIAAFPAAKAALDIMLGSL